MSTEHAQLTPPLLLLAMPQVHDPFFHRSVVLLIHHDEEGSLGFIINRRSAGRVGDVLKGMGIEWKGKEDLAVYFGGPVHPHLGTVLYDSSEIELKQAEDPEITFRVLEGVKLTRHVADLTKLAERPPLSFRLVLGYAGWGSGQLLQEILRNDWLTAPLRKEFIFSGDPEGVWAAALHSLGINPEALPVWMPGTDDGPVS